VQQLPQATSAYQKLVYEHDVAAGKHVIASLQIEFQCSQPHQGVQLQAPPQAAQSKVVQSLVAVTGILLHMLGHHT
jgi:hypothetical protein